MSTFSEYLLSKLQEFEKQQAQRISLDKFADHLGVKRPILSLWLSGGHSEAILKDLRTLEAEMVVIKKDIEQLDIPLQPVPPLTQPEIVTASQRLIQRLRSGTLEERRHALRGIVESIRTEKVGKKIYALITYYYPPPFDPAPMLPMSLVPMGAPLYRQLFAYPCESKEKPHQ